ncbi:MAG: peptide deformylase [Dehalococcoidia bacterium]
MAVRQICTIPNPVLRQKTKKVTSVDKSIQKLVDDMVETMREASGVGLAAPQIGVSLRVAVIEIPEEEVIVLINPEIVKRTGERIIDEACLSIPGYHGTIKRSEQVKVKALDRTGKAIRIKGEDLLAQALEHEIDHLDGVLYIDHLEHPDDLKKISSDEPQFYD